MHQKTGFC